MRMPFTEVSEGIFCMISTSVMLNGKKKKVILRSINDVLLMFVARWILYKCFEYMDGRDVQSLDVLACLTSLYKFPVKCMDRGIQ